MGDLSWVLSIAIVFAGLVGVAGLARWIRRRSRAAAVDTRGQPVLREAVDISVRLVVDHNAPGGLRAGTNYRSEGHLLLTPQRLILATNHGRVLELTPENVGRARAPGPRMMILEGPHPSGRANVRAELVLDNERDWLSTIQAQHLSA